MEPTTLTPIKEFTISRAVWLRGEGVERSYLKRVDDGKMCCVGICLSAMGVPDEQLAGAKTAIIVARDFDIAIPIWLSARGNMTDVGRLYASNDSRAIDPEERERFIIKGFADQGITVTFVD